MEGVTMKNRLVCDCYGITVDDIKTALQNGANGFEDLEKSMKLGVMCSACIDDAKKVIGKLKEEL
jgi:bacterioferritin-associated ferredoxin